MVIHEVSRSFSGLLGAAEDLKRCYRSPQGVFKLSF